MRIKTKILIVINTLVISLVVTLSVINYYSQKSTISSLLDLKLSDGVNFIKTGLLEDYHDTISGPESVSPEDYFKLVEKYHDICAYTGLVRIWSLMKYDSSIVYTSCSSSLENLDAGAFASFFDVHTEPEMYEPVFEQMEDTFQIITTKWGSTRAFLSPFTDTHGRRCLVAASMKTTLVNALFKKIFLHFLTICIIGVGLGIIFTNYVAKILSKPLIKISKFAKNIAKGDLDQTVTEKGSREVESLTDSLNTMSKAIKDKILTLKESEDRFRTLSEGTFEGVVIHNEGEILEANQQYYKMFGYPPDELADVNAFALTIVPASMQTIVTHAKANNFESYKVTGLKKDGTQFPIGIQTRMVTYAGQQMRLAAIRDLTKQKYAEEQMQKDIKEKELMLKEIHHRVKNNLTVISSLLNMQSRKVTNKEQALAAFEESRDRIYSMARVHEHLYNTDDFSKVDMQSYIETISGSLSRFYSQSGKVTVDVVCKDVSLDINTSIPCGLIINELVTNALKYAFTGDNGGTIKIEFERIKGKFYSMSVIDNGTGLPKDFNVDEVDSLGITLVKLLVEQLEGELLIESDGGAQFVITFPIARV